MTPFAPTRGAALARSTSPVVGARRAAAGSVRRHWLRWGAPAVALVVLLASLGFLLRPGAEAEATTKVVGAYMSDLPGGCDSFRVSLGGASAGADRYPLKLHETEVVLSDYHMAQGEGIMVASGEVPADVHGAIEVIIAGAHCLRQGVWDEVEVPQAVLTVRNAIPDPEQAAAMGSKGVGDVVAVFDFLLDRSLRLVPGPAGGHSIEFRPETEVHQVFIDPDDVDDGTDLPRLLADLLELVDGRIARLEDQVQRLDTLTQALVRYHCDFDPLSALCGLENLADLPAGVVIAPPADADAAGPGPDPTAVACAAVAALCPPTASPSSDPRTSPPPSTPPPPPDDDILPPSPITGLSPAEGSVVTTGTIAFAWQASHPAGLALVYDVILDGQTVCAAIAATTCSAGPAQASVDHSWEVRARAQNGPVRAASVRFTTDRPEGITPLNPTHKSSQEEITHDDFRWKPINPDGHTGWEYRVHFSKSAEWNAADPAVKCGWQAGTVCAFSDVLVSNLWYKWRVDYRFGGSGPVRTSDTWEFKGTAGYCAAPPCV